MTTFDSNWGRVYLMYLMNCAPPLQYYHHINFRYVKVENEEQILYDLIHRAEVDYAPEYIIKVQNSYTWKSKYKNEEYDKWCIFSMEEYILDIENMGDIHAPNEIYHLHFTKMPFYVPNDFKIKLPSGVDSSLFEIVPVHDDVHLIKHLLTTVRYDKPYYLQLTRSGKLIYRNIRKSFSDGQIFECDCRNINRIIDIMAEEIIISLKYGLRFSYYECCIQIPSLKRIFERVNQDLLRRCMPIPVLRDAKLVTSLFVSDMDLFSKLKQERNIIIDESFDVIEFIGERFGIWTAARKSCKGILWHRNYCLYFTQDGKLELFDPQRISKTFQFTSEDINLIKEKIASYYKEVLAALPSNVFADSGSKIDDDGCSCVPGFFHCSNDKHRDVIKPVC